MTMLILEGFEGYADVADVRRRHILVQTGTPTLVAGRYGGQALQMSTNNNFYLNEFGNPTTFVLGWAVYYSGTSLASFDMARFVDGITEHLVVRMQSGGRIVLDRGATEIDTASASPRLNSWTYFEFKATIDNSVGAYELRMDGVDIMSATGADTQNGAASQINLIELKRQSSGQEQYDDIYLLDDAGLTNNDFLGDIHVQTVIPDGDGNQNDFTADSGLTNWEMVDDGDSPDDDSTFNSSATLDDSELYTHTALAGTFDTVYAIVVRNHVRKENAGDRSVRALIRSNTDQAESAAVGLSTDWRYLDGLFETDPQGGGAWTETRVNACEMGMTIEA